MKNIADYDLISELKRRFDEKSNAIHEIIIMTNKIEELNERLRIAESHKSNFLSNIRNEINNPLTVIMGMANQLNMKVMDPKSVSITAETIYNEAFDLDFQLKNIFVAAEIEAGECSICASGI